MNSVPHHGQYHLTLIQALEPLDGLTEAPWWATDQFARLCMETGKPVAMLTVGDLLSAWKQVGDAAENHPKYRREA